jgi:hypothetical protein
MSESPAVAAGVESAPERVACLPELVLLLAASCLSVLGAVLIAPVLPQMAQEYAAVPGVAVLVPIVLTVPAHEPLNATAS